MTGRQKQMEEMKAFHFRDSMRGQYIISQALTIAAETMKKVKAPHKEASNIADMEYLQEKIYPNV